jgi:Rad3-related DNA helicase
MARIALGITLLFLLVTCFFGFETRGKVQAFADNIDRLNSQLANANQASARSGALLRAAKDEAQKQSDAAAAATAQLSTVQGNLDAANSQVATLTQQLQAAQQQIAGGPKPPPGPVTPTASAADMDKLNAQLKDAQAQIAELNAVKESLTDREKDAESRADDLQKIVDHYKNGTMRNGIQGEVLAYDPNWNFVVLSIGDHQGAVDNAEMILERGGSQIGKVRITSVEPSTSVADVIPGSLSRGVRVQPGDMVIFPGS